MPIAHDEVKVFFNELMLNPVETIKNTTNSIIDPFVSTYLYLAAPNYSKSKKYFK
jgi:hypothetical protein